MMRSISRRDRHRRDESQFCGDCQRDVRVIRQYFMVLRGIWEQYGNGDGLLCMDCLERRMGRQVVLDDFDDVMINAVYLAFHRERHLPRVPRIDFETLEDQDGKLLITEKGGARWIAFHAKRLEKDEAYLKIDEGDVKIWLPLASLQQIVLEPPQSSGNTA